VEQASKQGGENDQGKNYKCKYHTSNTSYIYHTGSFFFLPKFTGFFGVRIVVDMHWLVSWSAEGSQGQREKERKKERKKEWYYNCTRIVLVVTLACPSVKTRPRRGMYVRTISSLITGENFYVN